jgi:uncharacterized membrane protein
MAKQQHSSQVAYQPINTPGIHEANTGAAFSWLRQGAHDFASAPLLSLAYGVIFALLSAAIAYASMNEPGLTLTFMLSLLIVGPFLATGLYQVARGKSFSARDTLQILARHKKRLAVFVLMLLLITVAWIRLSSLFVAVYYGQLSPDIEFFTSSLSSPEAVRFVVPLMISAVVFAFLIFAASALSLPMIVDGKAETIPAFITSLKAIIKQPAAMLVWAGTIAALTLMGIATLFIGLVFIFPLLGYATWHSYQQLVKA